jgi:hypothetical protein
MSYSLCGYYDDSGDGYCCGCGVWMVFHHAGFEVEVGWDGRYFMINDIRHRRRLYFGDLAIDRARGNM